MNNEYVTGLHKYLQDQYGSEFKLNEQQFQDKLNNDPNYVNGLYGYLKEQYGSEFVLSPEEFSGKVKKKGQSSSGSNQTQPGNGSNNSQFDQAEYLRRAKEAGWNTTEEYHRAGHRYKENVSDEELAYIQPNNTNKKVIYRGSREEIENQLAPDVKEEISKSNVSETVEPVSFTQKFKNVKENSQAYDKIIDTWQSENKTKSFTPKEIESNYKAYAETALDDYLEYVDFTDRGGSKYQKLKEQIEYYKSLGDKLYNDESYADDYKRFIDLQQEAILNVNRSEIKTVNKLKDKYDWNTFNKKTSEVELKLSNIEGQIKNISSDGGPLTPLQQKKYEDLLNQYNQIQSDYVNFSNELGITEDVINQMGNASSLLSASQKAVSSIENEDNINSKRVREYKSQLLANKKAQEEFYGDSDQSWYEQFGKGLLNAGEQLGSTLVKGSVSMVGDLPQIISDAVGFEGYGVTDKLSVAADNINSYVDLIAPQLEDQSFPGFVKASGVIGNGLGSIGYLMLSGGGASKAAQGLLKTSSAKGLKAASRAGMFTAASSIGAGQMYDQLIEEGFSPAEASRYALAGGVVMGAAEMIVPEDKLLSNSIRRTFIGALRNKASLKDASKEALKFIYNRGTDIAKNTLQEAGEEALGQFAQDLSLQAASTISGKEIDGLWEVQPYINNALSGGGVGGVIELLKFGTRSSRFTNRFKESMLLELAENYDDISNKMSQIKPDDFNTIGERYAKLKNVNNALKDIPGFENLSHADKSHILALAYNKQVILDGVKQSGLDKSNFETELNSIETEIQSTLNKAKENAVQESSTEEVLPREQGTTSETGGQPQGMGQSVQGQEATQEGEKVSQEGVTPAEQAKTEAANIVAGLNAPNMLASTIYPVIGEVEAQMDNGEFVSDEKSTEAQDKLYELLGDIDAREDLTPEQKQQMSAVIENRIQKIQDYDYRTRTETSTTTQSVAAGVSPKTQKSNERAKTPIRTVAEEGVDVSYDGRPGRIELRDGQYVFVPKKLGAVQARPIVIGEAAQVNADSRFAGVENPTQGPNNSVANITLPNGSTLSILNDDLSIDVGLEIAKQEIGPAPQSLFDTVFEEIVTENKVEVPYLRETKPAQEQADTTQQAKEEVTPEATQEAQPQQRKEEKKPYTGTDVEARQLKEKYKADSLKRRILDQAQRIASALGNNTQVYIYETTEEYNKAIAERLGEEQKESTNGRFLYGDGVSEIHIDLSQANERTLPHEAVHAVLYKAFGDNQKLFQQFKDKLKPILAKSTVEALENFANQDSYIAEGTTAEEFMAELGGAMTAAGTRIPKNTLQKIAQLLNEFLSKITGGRFSPITTGEVIDLFNSMADAFASGKAVNLSSLNKLSEISNPGSQIDGNVIESKKSINNSIISDFDTTPIKEDNNPVNLIYPDKSSIEQVLEKSGGAAVFINSDGTKVGSSIINGKQIILHGGVDYTFIEKNVNEDIGFAASEDEKIKTLKTIAQEVSDMRDAKNPEHKGKPVAVFVVVQNGETMLGEWYAAEYIMEGLDKAITSKKYPGGARKAKSDFLKAIEAVKTNVKTVSGRQDEKSKNKLISFIKSNKFDTHSGRLEISKFLSSKEFSFGFRVNLNGELIPSNTKSWNSGKNRDFKQAMALSNHTMDEFYNNFLDGRLLKIIKATKLASNKGKSIANRTFSGFFYNPSESIENQINHAKLGIEHNQFNSSFKSEGNFLLENAHNVNSLNPDMGYPTKEGYNIYNKQNNTQYTKANVGLKEKNIISTWLNKNGFSNLVVNPYSSIALSIYTGYVEESKNKIKSNLKSKSQVTEKQISSLSKEDQNELLKDTSVLNIDGQTIFYHASDKDRKGRLEPREARAYGKGVYFASDKEAAEFAFGNKTTEAALNLSNVVEDGTKSFKPLQQLALEKSGRDIYDSEAFNDIDKKYVTEAANELGIDGIISSGQYGYEIVVLDDSKILYEEDIPSFIANEYNDISNDELIKSVDNKLKSKSQTTTVYNASPKEVSELGKRSGVAYFATNKREADEYARMNRGEVREFNIPNSDIQPEEVVIDKINELGLKPKDSSFSVDESSLFELIDDRFENSLSKSDIDKLFKALKQDGVKAFEYTDETQVVGGLTTSIAVIDNQYIQELSTGLKSKSQVIPKATTESKSVVSELEIASNKTGLAKENAVKRFIEKYGEKGVVAKEISDKFDKIQEELGITKICNI